MPFDPKRSAKSSKPAGGSSEYVIESDVPLPAGVRRVIYPFASMKEGDSFVLPSDERQRCISAAWTYGRKHGVKFSIRKRNGAMRCWHAGKREVA